MKFYRLNLFLFSLILISFPTRAYSEDETDFIFQLKKNGYIELALHHLDSLKSTDRVPDSLKKQIEFERAKILLEIARSTPIASKQREMLDEASNALEAFLSTNKNHPLAPEASAEKGRLLLEYARAELKRNKKDKNGNSSFQAKARKYLTEAKFIFDRSLKKNEAEFKKYELYIKSDEKEKRAQRDQAEQRYITSQYRQAICLYELSKTYQYDKKEEKTIRDDAFKKFGNIYLHYRRVVVGLYARMWQGKCYEENGEYRKAIGIYDELLSHPDQSTAVVNLQHQVLLFKLISLNNKKIGQYQKVVDEATHRLRAFPDIAQTRNGIAIRWQRALALKSLSESRDISESNRNSFLRQSLDDAQQISQYPGEFRSDSVQLMKELNNQLGYEKKAGQSFITANSDSKEMMDQISVLQQAIEKEKNEVNQQNKKRELLAHLEETRKQLELTISLGEANSDVSINELNSIRYLLSYVYLLTEENEKAGVLSEFIGHYYKKESPELALDSSYISAVSYLKAFESANGNKKTELGWVNNSANYLIKQWPEEKYSMEIALAAGKAFHKAQKYHDSTKMFNHVSSKSDYYGSAQLAAGQSLWSASLKLLSTGSGSTDANINQINEWKLKAEESLNKGIQAIEEKLKDQSDIPAELIIAKTILSQIYIREQKFEKALELLSAGEFAVTNFMNQTPPDPRPAKGPHSREFTGYYYQMLLRCFVATQQIEKSMKVMDQLDQLASGDQDSITAIYVNLGKVIQKEIEQLIAEKKTTELEEIQNSFDQFLSELYKRRDKMKYGSLVWIAETYYGLSSGLKKTDSINSKLYSEKALNTYEAILQRNEVPENNILPIKLRQVKCLKLQGDFNKSYQFLSGLLKKQPLFLDLQIEAALLLEEWGDFGDNPKYLLAIKGDPPDQKKKQVWGWGEIARKTQRIMIESGQNAQSKTLREKYWDSRYHISYCKWKYAIELSDTTEKQKMLQQAQREIEVFVSLTDHIDDQWVTQFNELYRNILNGLNPQSKSVASLNWDASVTRPAENKIQVDTGKEITKVNPSAKREPTTSFNSVTVIGGILVAILIIAGLIYFLLSSKKQQPHMQQLRENPFKSSTPPAQRRMASKSRKPDSQK